MPSQNSALDQAFVELQQKRLETLREEVLGPEKRRLSRERALQKERGGEAQEFEDDAQEMAENEIHQALHDANNWRLHAIERALQKIREGTYGFSDTSGDPIPRARLAFQSHAIKRIDAILILALMRVLPDSRTSHEIISRAAPRQSPPPDTSSARARPAIDPPNHAAQTWPQHKQPRHPVGWRA
jgi:DnaK suppressor protein